MKSRIPISNCEICKHLSSHNYAGLMYGSIPENMALLVGTSPTDHPADDIIECPTCGTFYSYTYACGFGENDITLRRMTPTEAGYEVDLDEFKRDLANPHDDTRAYAAQCLMEHYLSEGKLKEVDGLMNDEDVIIRSSAEASNKIICIIRVWNK